jgi:hypothetical protein
LAKASTGGGESQAGACADEPTEMHRPGVRAGLDIKNPCAGRFLRRKNTVTI